MPTGIEIFVVLAAYALGCVNAGYYLVRWRTGQDVRGLGTGTAGARNVGRVLGPVGFAATFAFDAAKGVAAVCGARGLGVRETWLVAVMLAVVAGHVWPIQLGLRGGKGASPAVGAVVAFTPWMIPALVAAGVAAWPVLRNATTAGMAGFALAPLLLWLTGRATAQAALSLAAVAALVVFAHRSNILRQSARRIDGPHEAQSGDER
jgi:glycerol-3-phosphate acyltransferase PlsY